MRGDNEKARSDSISPFMDRMSPSLSRSQLAFMSFVLVPVYESIAEFLPSMHFTIDYARENKQYWSEHDDTV